MSDSRTLSDQGARDKQNSHALRVLVVDDDETNRIVLDVMLRKDGHTVFLAQDGEEAVSLYNAKRPDLVLMDIMMPVMDGYEATQSIKADAGNHFVPIIFLTALTDEQALAKCLEVGGDDFITKPVGRIILRAKLAAAARMRGLYVELERQQRDLSVIHERLRYEHKVAEEVFAKIVGSTGAQAANIRSELLPFAITNGDLLLVAQSPSGSQYILLGDCTGHGLSAAIGAIPVTDIFYAMTRKGFGIREIVAEMNRKLHATLPTGQFLAACLLEWDHHRSTMKIWNGGMPDVIRIAESDVGISGISSRNLPLGIVANEEFNIDVEVRRINHGDRIFLYSDGLIDARCKDGEMFGQERLAKIMRANHVRNILFDEIRCAVADFRDGQPQEDDITLVEVLCDAALLEKNIAHDSEIYRNPHYELSVSLGPQVFRHFDPLYLNNALINGVAALDSHRSYLYMIIVELYANSLEHGILGLDCALKKTPEGFSRYYVERERLLSELTEGWMRIDIECFGGEDGGELILQIEDSGNGFDAAVMHNDIRADSYTDVSGRGMEMVRSLCKSLTYDLRGNFVRAVYVW